MPSEIYETTHFGYSTANGFGSIYHEHNNKSNFLHISAKS